jgi:hypothetical protein
VPASIDVFAGAVHDFRVLLRLVLRIFHSPGGVAATPDCYGVKLTFTVMTTGTGTPFCTVGVYSHCWTASSAA